MHNRDEQRNIKAIRHLQRRSDAIDKAHDGIGRDILAIKKRLENLGDIDKSALGSEGRKPAYRGSMINRKELPVVSAEAIYDAAEAEFPERVSLGDILSPDDHKVIEQRIGAHISDFNARYDLDRWDYAIAGGCGLFAAMLDLLCVKAPATPTTAWTKKVDGVFNKAVQEAFNRILPPDVSKELAKLNPIGGADASTVAQLFGAPPGTLNPTNHRLRSLSHDPVLGFLFGVLDMRRGTCTVVRNGRLFVYETASRALDGNLFTHLGRMFGHLLSDVNAPSSNANRGMGLPAPFMGVLRMFENLPVGDSDLSKQIEYMYVNGYDFRQFLVTSIPVLVMEVMMRVFYAVKQVELSGSSLGEALMETAPGTMNPRFRMMLAMGYGTVAAVNGARVLVTKDILNCNYAAWLGLVWNGFHSLKWAALDRNLRIWEEFENKEIGALDNIVHQIEGLVDRANRLPV